MLPVFIYQLLQLLHVPSERLFSKAGELVSAKRNRIKAKNVDMMLFVEFFIVFYVSIKKGFCGSGLISYRFDIDINDN